jgi:hypothetical protein
MKAVEMIIQSLKNQTDPLLNQLICVITRFASIFFSPESLFPTFVIYLAVLCLFLFFMWPENRFMLTLN